MLTLEKLLLRWSWLLITLVLISIAVFKGGIGMEIGAQDAEPTFPLPQPGMAALSFGLPAIVWILGIQGQVTLIGLTSIALSIALLALIAWRLNRMLPGETGRGVTILLLLSPVTLVLLNNIGRHDFLVICGALLIASSLKNPALIFVGVSAMVLGNPEQSVFATFSFLLLSFSLNFAHLRKIALFVFSFSAIAYVVLALWARSLGIDSRIDLFQYHFKVSLLNFFGNLPLSLYAVYGVLWLFVFWLLRRSSKRDRFIVSAALISVPLAITIVTLDQTRVFVGVSTLAVAAALVVMGEKLLVALRKLTATPLAWIFLVAVFLPAIEITYEGGARIPFLWIYNWAANAGLAAPLDMGPW